MYWDEKLSLTVLTVKEANNLSLAESWLLVPDDDKLVKPELVNNILSLHGVVLDGDLDCFSPLEPKVISLAMSKSWLNNIAVAFCQHLPKEVIDSMADLDRVIDEHLYPKEELIETATISTP